MTRKKSASAKSASGAAKRSGKKGAGRSAGKKKRPLPAERTRADGGPPDAGRVAGQALRESEEKYRALVEQSLQGLLVMQGLRIVFANPTFAEISGYTVDELVSLSPEEVTGLVHPGDQAIVWKRFEDRLAGKPAPARYECRLIRKDGSGRWVEMCAGRIEYGGKPAIQGTFVDLTDRKQAEKKVQENERFLQEVFDAIQDGISVRDCDLNVIRTNRWMERKYASEMPLVGRKCYEVFQKRESPCPWCPAIPTMETGKPHTQVVPYPSAEDPTGWIELWAFPVEDAEGNVVGAIEHVRDITDRRRVEEALRESEGRFRQFFENEPEYCYMISPEGTVIDVNPAALEALGYRKGELVGKPLSTVYAPESLPKAREVFQKWEETGIVKDEELVIVTRDGARRTVLLSAGTTRDDEGRALCSVSVQKDITDRKRAEEAVARAARVSQRIRALLVAMNACHAIEEVLAPLLETALDVCDMDGGAVYLVEGEVAVVRHHVGLPQEFVREVERMALSRAGVRAVIDAGCPVNVDEVSGQLTELYRAHGLKHVYSVPLRADQGVLGFLNLASTCVEAPSPESIETLGVLALETESALNRLRAEQNVREREARLESIFRAAPVGIGVVSNRVVKEVNTRLCEMLGYGPDELIGRSVRMLYPTEEDYEYVDREKCAQIRDRGTGTVESRWQRKDGTVIDVLLRSSAIDPHDLSAGVTLTALDVTESKRAREALRESEEQYRTLVEASPGAVFLYDEGKFIFANPAGARMLGISDPEEMVGMGVAETIASGSHALVAERIANLERGGHNPPAEIEALRMDGSSVWIESISVQVEVQGKPVKLIVGHDVTERRRAVKAQREEKERAQKYLDIAGVILVALGADERVTLINRKGCEVLGRSEEEVVGRNWFDIAIPERERERVRRTFAMLMAGSIKPTEYFENLVVTSDGTERIIGWRNTVLKDAAGKIVGTLSSGEDVTERKEAEEALCESEERFRAVFEKARDGILLADRETRRLADANRAICEMLGYTPEELLSLRADDLHPTQDVARVMETFERQARGEITLAEDIPVRRKDGSVFYADINSSSVTLAGEPYIIGVFRDVTDRRRAEEELANAQALLLAAIEQTPAGIVIAEPPDVRIRVANSAALGIRGETTEPLTDIPAELHPTNWELFYPDGTRYQGGDFPLSRAVLRGETSRNVEVVMRRSDGSERLVLVNAAPVRNAQGQIVAGVVVFPDITERKQAAEVLDFERRQLLSIFESIDEPVFVTDPETYEVLYANRAARDMFGDVVGQVCYRVLQGRESPCPFCTNDRILGENVGQAYIWEHQNPLTGRWYRCIDRAIRWPDGRTVRYEMAIDVTERKRAVAALQESEEKFRGIAERSFDIIFTMDLQGNLTYLSPAVEGVFLYKPEEMLGRPFTDFVPESEMPRALRFFSEAAAGEEVGVVQAEAARKDGRRISIEINSSRILEGGQLVGIQGIIRDVTERNAAEEELHRTEAQLAHVGRLSTMDELVGGIAHEVSQPLYSVLNFAKASRNVLTAEEEPNLDDLRDWSEHIAAAAARAGQIIARLRSFVRRTEPQRSPANINEVVEESVELVAFEARRRQVAVKLELGETLPVVHVDRVQIQQVMVNLLRNAYEALDQSPAGTRRVIVRTSQPGESVEIAVADNGPGLPPKDDLNPFDAFATSKPGGLGIGLAISRTIIEAHGGDLWAAPTPNGGATFHFTLPISRGGPSGGTRTDRIRRG